MTHSTKWVEEKLDLSGIAAPAATAPVADDGVAPLVERSTTVEVNGKRFDVKLWVPDTPLVAASGAPRGQEAEAPLAAAAVAAAPAPATRRPMQGTIVKVLVEVGQAVEAGQAVVVLEAMKMENQINAETAGTVKEIKVAAGDTVGAGDVVVVVGKAARRGGRRADVACGTELLGRFGEGFRERGVHEQALHDVAHLQVGGDGECDHQISSAA